MATITNAMTITLKIEIHTDVHEFKSKINLPSKPTCEEILNIFTKEYKKEIKNIKINLSNWQEFYIDDHEFYK